MSIFNHNSVTIPQHHIKISPSQIANFFNYPSLWYEENIENKPPSFIGNTSSLIGTCCHYIYEQYGKNTQYFTENKEQIFEYVNKELEDYLSKNIAVATNCDLNEVLNTYPLIAREVINNYICKNLPHSVETPVWTTITGYDNISIAGTIDNITDTIIVDYKNVGTKPSNLTSIPFNYKIQLLAYKYALKQMCNKEIDQIRIVYGVAPTKTLPARCFVVTETVTKEDDEMFNDTIRLIAESIKRCKEDKTLIPLIFKSMKLEQYTGGNYGRTLSPLLM